MFVLFNAIFAVGASVIDGILDLPMVVYGLYGLATLIPSLAVAIRRLHDTGKSGWYLLVGLIPLVGIWLIILLATEGNMGENEYGEDPT